MTDSLGRLLKRARSQREVSLEDASEATRIRLHYLQALEADDYSVMPSAAQGRGFLKNYCAYLEVDLEEALAEIQKSPGEDPGGLSGPLPEVDILPPPPEPAASARPTVPSRRLPAAEASILPPAPAPAPSRRSRLGSALRIWQGKRKTVNSGEAEHEEAPTPAVVPPEAQPPAEAVIAEKPARLNLFQKPGAAIRPQPHVEFEEPQEAGPVEETPPAPAQSGAAPPPVDEPDETAEKIFAEIGMELRRRRELLSLTPEEVDHHIHIREVFIRAMERGDFSQLPSAVQTRGMLANYAAFLDLDTDALLLRFADSLQASHRARHPVMPGSKRPSFPVKPKVPPLRGFVAGDLLFGLALVVLVVALIVWGLGRVFADQAERVVLPTAPSISDVLAGTSNPLPTQAVIPIPVLDTPVVTEAVSPTAEANLEVPAFTTEDPNVAVRVTISVVERTFMRVMLDGEQAFNGRVVPGAAYTYEATTTIQVLTGNGAALRVTYNGRDLGLLGDFGQVVSFIYTANTIITPAPPAPSSTPSLPVTVTSTPTLTPTP